MSETAKHRHLVLPFCQGSVLDIGSSGDPVVPWAIQLDLPLDRYIGYGAKRPDAKPCEKCGFDRAAIHLRCDCRNLPFKDGTLDAINASHVLEDFPVEQWPAVLREWDRVLKVGAFMLIAVPDHERFRAYVERGKANGIDCDNLSHKHESRPGELTEYLGSCYHVFFDKFVSDNPQEYSVIFAGAKHKSLGAP